MTMHLIALAFMWFYVCVSFIAVGTQLAKGDRSVFFKVFDIAFGMIVLGVLMGWWA